MIETMNEENYGNPINRVERRKRWKLDKVGW
jgi:hypothetical protein